MRKWLLGLALVAVGAPLMTGEATAQGKDLTLERLYASPDLAGTTPRKLTLSPDGKYVTLLRNRRPRHVVDAGASAGAISGGFRQLGATLRDLRRYPLTLWFLGAYLLFNDGVQTVSFVAAATAPMPRSAPATPACWENCAYSTASDRTTSRGSASMPLNEASAPRKRDRARDSARC